MRKLAFFCVCIFVLFNGAALAKLDVAAIPKAALDAYLADAHFPEELIQTLPYSVKLDLFQEEGVYCNHTIEKLHLYDSTDYKRDSVNGLLSLPNFTHSILTARLPTTTPGIARYYMSYSYLWDYKPGMALTDKYGIAWNGDWNFETGSFRAGYEYNQPFYEDNWINADSRVSLDTASPGTGVGWKVDLYYGNGTNVFGHAGYGRVILLKAHDGSGRADVSSYVGQYFHKWIGIDGSLTFSKTPGINITWKVNYDSSSPHAGGWIWYHRD